MHLDTDKIPTDRIKQFEQLSKGFYGMVVTDMSHNILWINPELCSALQFDVWSLTGMALESIVPDRTRDWHRAAVREAIEGGLKPSPMNGKDRSIAVLKRDRTPIECYGEIFALDHTYGVIRLTLMDAHKADETTQLLSEGLCRATVEAAAA